MRVLYIFWVLLMGTVPAIGNVLPDEYYERVLREEEEVFVPCEALETERLRCERIKKARELAGRIELKTYDQVIGKKRIPYREFALIAYDPETEGFHVIRLGMPVDVSKTPNFQPIVLSKGESPITVTRLRGQSLNKMVFDIRFGGRELHAYAAKHLLFTEVVLHALWGSRKIPRVEEVVYLEVTPHFVTSESASAGQAVFMSLIEEAFDELRQRGIPSRSFPGRLVADVIPTAIVANLLVTEQTDPCFRQGTRPKGCEHLIPIRPYADDAEVMQAVNTVFFLNGGLAYRYMRSSAAAGGALQFTNNKTNRYIGTYNLMLLYYPKAGLDPDFQRATRSLRNLAKAAACLIDLELANAQLPTWAKEVFFRDPEFGLPIPGAAYNGGASQSLLVARLIETYAKKQGIDKERYLFHLFPWDHFLAWVDESRAKLKPETRGYIEKIIAVTRHLSRHRPRLPVVNFEGDLG